MNNSEKSHEQKTTRLKKVGYFLFHKSLVRMTEYYKENLGDESIILAPNHTSDRDGPVFWSSIDNLRIMAKKECFDNKVKGWFLTKIGVVGVDRSKGSLRVVDQAVEYLSDKTDPKIYMMFPQGTISDINKNTLRRIKEGVFIIAALSNTPIVPVFIEQPRFFKKSRIIYGEKMHVNIDDIYLDKAHKKFNRENLNRLKEQWQQEIFKLQRLAIMLEERPLREIRLKAKHANNNDGDPVYTKSSKRKRSTT